MLFFRKNSYGLSILFSCTQFILLMWGCAPQHDVKHVITYSSVYDSLYEEVVYMDSLVESDNLLLLESHLERLVAGEAAWSQAMDVPENTWMYFWVAYFHNRLGDLSAAKRYSNRAMAGRFMREMAVKHEADRKNDQIGLLHSANGRERWANTVYSAGLALLAGVALLIVMLMRRISRQKKVLEDVNAAKDRLFSLIAHDLRSPMIALQGMGKLMSHYIRKKDEQKLLELGNQAGETQERVNHLLDNLLNWAVTNGNQLTYHPATQNMGTLLEEALTLHRPAAEAKAVRLTAEVVSVPVFVDLNMTATVLRNLISNAIKHAPEGSEVAIAGMPDRCFYRVSIEDEGEGIPQEVLDRLREDNEKLVVGSDNGSFGLGLRLAKHFAGMNRGKLTLKNGEKGALAVLHLPLAN